MFPNQPLLRRRCLNKFIAERTAALFISAVSNSQEFDPALGWQTPPIFSGATTPAGHLLGGGCVIDWPAQTAG